ncbi:hypothetical protein DFH09DRAFT_893425, partial [Mycena vulgaris]
MRKQREEMASLGAKIEDKDFIAIIQGSMPESYQSNLSTIITTSRIAKVELTPNELINYWTEEAEH